MAKSTPHAVTAGQAFLLTATAPAQVYQDVKGNRVLIKKLAKAGYTTFIPSADLVDIECDGTYIVVPTSAHADTGSTDSVSNTNGADPATVTDGTSLYERAYISYTYENGQFEATPDVAWTDPLPRLSTAKSMWANCTRLVSFKPEGGLPFLEDATLAWIGCGLREFEAEMPCVCKLNAALAHNGQLKHVGVYSLPVLEDAYNAFAYTYLPKSEIIRIVGILPDLIAKYNLSYSELQAAGLATSAKTFKEHAEHVLWDHAQIHFTSEFGNLAESMKGGAYELIAAPADVKLLQDYAHSKGWNLNIAADNGDAPAKCYGMRHITGEEITPQYNLTYTYIDFFKTNNYPITGQGAWANVNCPYSPGKDPRELAAEVQAAIGGNTLVSARQYTQDGKENIVLDVFCFEGELGAQLGINNHYSDGLSPTPSLFDGHIHREGIAF